MAPSSPLSHRLHRGWRKSRAAARFNLLPGTLLLACGTALVVAYYRIPAVSAALEHVVRLREQMGVLFPMLSTAFFGGAFPLIIRRIFLGAKETAGGIAFSVLFWAEKGWEVDLLYHLQARAWGDDTEPLTIMVKIITDQFVYCPLFAAPTMTLAYLWRDASFSFAGMRRRLHETSFLERVIPIMISNWVIWIPGVCVIYAFPLPLQLPLQNIILSIFVLILVLVSSGAPESKRA